MRRRGRRPAARLVRRRPATRPSPARHRHRSSRTGRPAAEWRARRRPAERPRSAQRRRRSFPPGRPAGLRPGRPTPARLRHRASLPGWSGCGEPSSLLLVSDRLVRSTAPRLASYGCDAAVGRLQPVAARR